MQDESDDAAGMNDEPTDDTPENGAGKNLVLCFDHDKPESRATTNVRAIFDLLEHEQPDAQLAWYHSGVTSTAGRRRSFRRGYHGQRNSLVDAYVFLVDWWEPGDRIYVFGAGCGAFCARALARLLNTIGVLDPDSDALLHYVLENWALPHTHRTPEDWQALAQLASALFGMPDGEIGVDVEFLGLWDTVNVPGLPRISVSASEALDNVITGRHAVAIDERRVPTRELLMSPAAAERVEEVWFRGTHADITGGTGGRRTLSDITLKWILEGAVQTGLLLGAEPGQDLTPPVSVSPTVESDSAAAGLATVWTTAGARLGLGNRSLPDEALVHASVKAYVAGHPEYWYRLPGHMQWADVGWLARSERLMTPLDATLIAGVPAELTA